MTAPSVRPAERGTGGSFPRRSTPCGPFLVLLLFLLLGAIGQGQAWELRVCAEPNALPLSNRDGEGFENVIARILASEMGAQPVFVWLPTPDPRMRELFVQRGSCDVVMGVSDGQPGFLTTLAYYRSSYVFVYRQDRSFSIESLDDQELAALEIGVQVGGRGVGPPTLALANRDLLEQQVGLQPDPDDEEPLSRLVDAVVEQEVDVAIAWGPVAGYFASRRAVPLEIVPVTPQIEPPFVPMVSSIAIGVRMGDEALRDELDLALAARWEEIQQVLRDYDVPLLPLPAPTLGAM